MPSYQDIETRLLVVEDKIDFIMKSFPIRKKTPSTLMPGEFIVEDINLLDLYRELKATEGTLEQVKD